MKRFLILSLAVLVLATMMAIPALAAGGSVAVSPATGASGSVVTVTVSLADFEQATTLGITYSGTPEMVKGSCDFLLPAGTVEDIGNEVKNTCVWAVSQPISVNTEVLELALKLPEYDGTRSYSCSVSVIVKRNSEELGQVTKNFTVNVSNPAESVGLDKSALALDLCGTKTGTLVATVGPASATDTVVWTTSDATVATVSGGTVTALKTGTATITATAGAKSASCTVTVTCAHTNAVKTEAADPTCQKTGNYAYYTCGDCGKVLTADKSAETTVQAQTRPVVSHSGGTATCTAKAVCTMCGQSYGNTKAHSYATAWSSDANQHWHICTTCNVQKGSLANHSFSWKVDKAATEDATGLKHEQCACGYKRNENTVIPKLDHVHVGITKHAGVAATCIKTGTATYWTCSSAKCAGKYYSDAKCQLEVTSITLPIDATNHAGKTELRDQVAATCATAGYSGDTWCLDCKTMSKKGAVVAATGKHTAKADYLKDDNQHWQECSVCNGIIGNKANHSFAWVVDKAATESATGLKHEACATCKLERSKDTVIDKLPHIPAKVEAKAATCTEEGALEHFYCPNCEGYFAAKDGQPGDAIKKEDVIIPALGHSFGEDWQSDEKGHWHICATCEGKSEVEAHTTELVGAVDATETAEGYSGDQVCTVCQAVVTQGTVIPVVTPETTEPAAVQDETGADPAVVIAVSVLALAGIGGGAFLFVKKPWLK